MNQQARQRHDKEAGATLVEFSLAASVFLLALFGVLEISRLLWTYNALADGVRRGARYAALNPVNSETAVRNMVVYGTASPGEGAAPIVYGLTTERVTVTYSGTFGVQRGTVTVRVSGYAFQFIALPPLTGSLTLPEYQVSITGESAGIEPGNL